MSAIFTLTTDFGFSDAYVAILKGSILGAKPSSTIIDVSHFIPPRDIMAGGWILKQAYAAFPDKTIHLAAVGSRNEITTEYLAIAYDNHFFVCPNNGLFSLLVDKNRSFDAVFIELRKESISSNFSAKNILVPAAIALAEGESIKNLGKPATKMVTYKWAEPFEDKNGIQGMINHVDHYGNLITNIPVLHFNQIMERNQIVGRTAFKIYIGNTIIRQESDDFFQLEDQDPFAVKGPSGMMEISVKGGNASELLSVVKGAPVSVVLG
jgi:S-adenosylmethionine hydrolase